MDKIEQNIRDKLGKDLLAHDVNQESLQEQMKDMIKDVVKEFDVIEKMAEKI